MVDYFEDFTAGLDSPPSRAQMVAPSDNTDLAVVSRGINVATTGTVRLTTLHGDDVTLTIAAGIAFPIRATRIWATGTSATGIVAVA